MSLLEFQPLNAQGRPYAIQEYNGRIVLGTEQEFKAVHQSEVLSDYPTIEKTQLSSLQHSISKDNMKNVFAVRETGRLEQAWERWSQDGITGVVDHVANVAEPTKFWPLAKIGRGVLKVHNGMSSVASKLLYSSQTQEKVEELMNSYGHTLDWKNNWLRCVALHPDGKRLAVCQRNDHVRVYGIGPLAQKTPLTLKHPQQTNVGCMAWEPFDQRVLAVAAGSRIIIWRLTMKNVSIKPSSSNAQVIDLGCGPISQIVWDKTTSSGLLVVSPNSNKIMLVDTSTSEVDSVGAWTGGSVTRIVPSPDGRRIAVMYTGSTLRVYERDSWRDEKWTSLPGRAVDAVWSPSGDCLLFATDNHCYLFTIRFKAKTEKDKEGQAVTTWVGDPEANKVFDLSPVEFDPSELELQGGVERPIITIGGRIHSLTLSPDGQRLAVSFRDNPSVIALFILDWSPVLRLTPCGFIEAPQFGGATQLGFIPHFKDGALLYVGWSGGRLQYLPMVYGANASMLVPTRNILDEISSRIIGDESRSLLRAGSVSESLRSGDLPSSLQDKSENDEEVLFSERRRRLDVSGVGESSA